MPSPLLRPALTALFLLASLAEVPAQKPPPSPPSHVVLMVWDGMRPDFITPQFTPNLHALAQRGTFFANNHSFWPTTTEVNGTILATGVFPSRSTIVANSEYRPDINPRSPVHTEAAEVVRQGDELTGGKYLGALTVAELARQAGHATAIAGTKGIALLHDRAPERPATPRSGIVFAGKAYPVSIFAPLVAALGPFPQYSYRPENPAPNTAGNLWTTRALLEHLWRDALPRYSVLWLSDPDFPQHATAPGDPTALAGIADSDRHLGLLLAALEKRGALAKTDIFIVSDHGFSTIEQSADAVKYFNDHGVPVVKQFNAPPTPGQVIYVNVGGASSLHVIGHDATVIDKLVTLLQASDFAGAIFTRDALPGTFPLRSAHLDSPASADIVFSFRWREAKNVHGAPGLILAEGRAGKGTHGTLSRFDVRNTLVAAGPSIRAGFRSELPSGNIDVAPTILHLLGLEQPGGSDGRVLTEALAAAKPPEDKPVTRALEASRELRGDLFKAGTTWRQYLQTTTFAGKTYFDHGNAGAPPAP